MSRTSKRERNTRRRAQRKAAAAREKYGDVPDPLYVRCRRCLARPRERCVGSPGFHDERILATHGETRLHPGNGVRLRRPFEPNAAPSRKE